MSKDYSHEVGYESLLKDFERYRKQSPRGVGLTKKDKTIALQFKVGDKSRSQYGCNCSFTLDGMVDALSKARKVAEALKKLTMVKVSFADGKQDYFYPEQLILVK